MTQNIHVKPTDLQNPTAGRRRGRKRRTVPKESTWTALRQGNKKYALAALASAQQYQLVNGDNIVTNERLKYWELNIKYLHALNYNETE